MGQYLFEWTANQWKTPVSNTLAARTAEKWFLHSMHDVYTQIVAVEPWCLTRQKLQSTLSALLKYQQS